MQKTGLFTTGILSILFGGFFIAVNWSVNRDTNNSPFCRLHLFRGMLVLAGLWHLDCDSKENPSLLHKTSLPSRKQNRPGERVARVGLGIAGREVQVGGLKGRLVIRWIPNPTPAAISTGNFWAFPPRRKRSPSRHWRARWKAR